MCAAMAPTVRERGPKFSMLLVKRRATYISQCPKCRQKRQNHSLVADGQLALAVALESGWPVRSFRDGLDEWRGERKENGEAVVV